MRRLASAALLALLWITVMPAALVATSTPGVTHETDGYTGFTTQLSGMVGLNVTVEFLSGNVDSQTWSATGITASDWTMTQGPGSTFSRPFVLTNLTNDPIVSFAMHGGFSTTLFDRGVSPSTPGTANGRDIIEAGTFISVNQDVSANYFDQIQTVGSTPVGDIYAGLDVDFEIGFVNQFRFITDTDTASTLIRPVVTGVPEPNGIVFAIVLCVTSTIFRRKRHKRPVR